MDKDSFKYYQNDPTKVFPIDYSMRRFDPKRGGNITYVQSMIEHPFIKDILLDLVWDPDMPQDLKRSLGFKSRYCLPVETETFMRCFYKLMAEQKYHITEKKKEKLKNDDIKRDFSVDLCVSIAENVFSYGESNQCDDAIYCRRMLSQEAGFRRVIMDDLWENELSDRLAQIRELTEKVSPEQQIPVLQNVLQILDHVCLQLIQLRQADDGKCSSSEPPAPEVLLKRLLSNRKKATEDTDCKRNPNAKDVSPQEKLAIYEVKNSNFTYQINDAITNTDLKSAFLDLEGTTNPDSSLMERARLAYMENLESMTRPSSFEAAYLELRRYIDIVSKQPNSDYLKQCFTEIMKEQCRHEIDYMMCTFRKEHITQPTAQYLDVLIHDAARCRAEAGIQCFDNIWELIGSFALISRTGTKLDNQFGILRPSTDTNTACSVKVPLIYRVPRKKYFLDLREMFVKYWIFAGHRFPLDASGHFVDLKSIAKKFSRGAQEAAEFFDKGTEFLCSADEVWELLQTCDDYATAADDYMSGNEIADLSFPILAMAMLQTLQRITEDGVSGLMKDFPILQQAQAAAKEQRQMQQGHEKKQPKAQTKQKQNSKQK